MNNKQIKTAFKAIIWLSLIQLSIVKASPMPWYQQYFSRGNGTEYAIDHKKYTNNVQYAENCKNINTTQNRRGIALFIYLRMTHKKANLNQALSLIQDLLTDFETQLIAAEQETLIAIKEKYQMSDEIWQKCLTEMQQIKNSYKHGMLQSHANVTHDSNIPADVLEMLTALLQENGINPQSIHLKMVSHQEANVPTNWITQAKSIIAITRESNNFTFSYDYIPSIIEIFPPLLDLPVPDKISFCAHEIQHLIQHHSLTEIILTEYLQHYCNVNTAEFKKTPEYLKLAQIHEAQAEVLSAIKSPKIAECLKTMRANNSYPDHLYEEHFCDLSSIDMLWKVHGWLEFIHHDGLIKVRIKWFEKIKECGNSIKQLLIPMYVMTDTIKEKLYKSIEKPAIYNAGVYAIDRATKLISNTIVRLSHLTHKQATALQKIDRRLNQIKENLKRDEHNAIKAMYKEFNVSNEEQQTINSILSQYKEFEKQYLAEAHENNNNLQEATVELPELLSFCKQVNIHPTAVELEKSNTPNACIASSTGLRASYQFENDKLIVSDNDIIGYPTITFYPNFFEQTDETALSTIGHELTHLALQHLEVLNILTMEIKYFTKAKTEDILNSKNWKNLETISERQAEILHKDAAWAAIMRNCRNKSYYSGQLFLKHYAQLAEIDELHKLKEKLTL